jgi:hypothetical protein
MSLAWAKNCSATIKARARCSARSSAWAMLGVRDPQGVDAARHWD